MKSVLKVLMLLVVAQFTVQACAKSVVNAGEETKIEKKVTVDEVTKTYGDEDSLNIICEPKWGIDSAESKAKYVKYRAYFEQGKYAEAYPLWKYVFINAPCATEQLLADGHYMLDYLASYETTVKRRTEMVDTMVLVYNYRLKLYPKDRGTILEKKGYSLSRLSLNNTKADSLKILSYFEEAYKLNNGSMQYYSITPFFQYSKYALKQGDKSLDDFIKLFFELSDVAAKGVARGGSYEEYWRNAEQNLLAIAQDVLNCDKLVPYYTEKFNADPQNLELIKGAMSMLESKNCDDAAIYDSMLEKLAEIEPGYEVNLRIAKKARKKGQYQKALSYYQKAIDGADSASKKIDPLYEMALMSLNNMNNCSQARSYARQILAINPNYGMAYIVIGDAYAKCNSGVDPTFDDASVYWAAVDQYNKAKAVDASVASLASSRISSYTSRFPKSEKIFFVPNVNEGDSYKIGGWINETTIVRARPE